MESLNLRALAVCEQVVRSAKSLGVEVQPLDDQNLVLDFGVAATGGLEAGLLLARICSADLCDVQPAKISLQGQSAQAIRSATTEPIRACLASQYAGWQIACGKYFAICSGPIRAAYGKEPLFDAIGHRESADRVVGVLETSRLPDPAVFAWLRERLPKTVQQIVLCIAPTNSLAGRIQIVARSVETACHKLFELGFDLRKVKRGRGVAPLPPAAANDFEAMGSTNDAILLAGRVKLVVDADDHILESLGPKIPSCSSPQFGQPFAQLFEASGRDFYKLDPALFAPAEITLHSARTSWQKTFGIATW